jgi:hypothetical protein
MRFRLRFGLRFRFRFSFSLELGAFVESNDWGNMGT